jgi:hypothetical protein
MDEIDFNKPEVQQFLRLVRGYLRRIDGREEDQETD